MLAVFIIIFLAVLAVIVLVTMAIGGPKTSKQTRAALDSVLKTSRSSTDKDKDQDLADVRKSELLSAIPWLHELLARISAAIEMRRRLDQADLKWTPARLLLMAVAAWIISAYVINARTDFGFVSLLLGLVPGALPFVYVSQKRSRRFMQFQKKLPETLDLMVSALRAGHSMSGALGAAASEAPEPVGRELRLCFEEQNFGVDLRTAVENLIHRVPLQDLRIITTAMLINKESGGNLAEVLDKTSSVIRERFRIQQTIRVHTAQGRLSGAVLGIMPLVLGVVLYFESPKYIRLLFTEPLGHKMLAIAGTMNVIGFLIIRKIVNIRV
jgi:tight adherence protein B